MSPTDNQLTGYAKALKKVNKYPLPPHALWKDRIPDKEHPVATPFLVIPAAAGDPPTNRPLESIPARHFDMIEVIDTDTQLAVTTPSVGKAYIIRCKVRNQGAVGSYAGIAEFYLASPQILNELAAGDLRARPAPLGYAGFMVPSGGQTTVTCPKPWTVTELNQGILVRMYDPIVDKTDSYNSARDRHVARRDTVPDFSGTYAGGFVYRQKTDTQRRLIVVLKIVIQQVNNVATISVDKLRPGGAFAIEIRNRTAVVDGSDCKLVTTETRSGRQIYTDICTFTPAKPKRLHFTLQRQYISQNDRDLDFTISGNLIRV